MLTCQTSCLVVFILGLTLNLTGCYLDIPSAGSEVVGARLEALLKDPHPDVRRTAAEALGKIGRGASAAALIDHLHDPDSTVRQASAWALGQLGEEVANRAGLPLVSRLTDGAGHTRNSAALALGEIGGTPAVIEELRALLRGGDVAGRRAAVYALSGMDQAPVYELLVHAIRDEDSVVRQGATAALGELADSRAVPILRERLLKDAASGVRSEAAFRLGKIGDGTLVAELKHVAETDRNARVRRWADWATQQLSQGPDFYSRR